MEITYSDLKDSDRGQFIRKPLELVKPPMTLIETNLFEDARSKTRIMFEEQIRDLFSEDMTAESLGEAMEKVCDLGEVYWQKVEDEAKSNFPEHQGRLVADIEADFERARLTFEGSGNFPRQVARVINFVTDLAPKLIEENYENLVTRRLMVNYRTGKVSRIKFRNSASARNFKESQEKERQLKLKRIQDLKALVLEQYPESKDYLEVEK